MPFQSAQPLLLQELFYCSSRACVPQVAGSLWHVSLAEGMNAHTQTDALYDALVSTYAARKRVPGFLCKPQTLSTPNHSFHSGELKEPDSQERVAAIHNIFARCKDEDSLLYQFQKIFRLPNVSQVGTDPQLRGTGFGRRRRCPIRGQRCGPPLPGK